MYISLWTERVSRLFFISALAWLDEDMFQSEGSEKSSLRISSPSPGRISGVGGLVDKTCRVGVAEAGNQFMVAVGSGVSVGVGAMGVASSSSSVEQDERNIVIARSERNERRSNPQFNGRLLRRDACPGGRCQGVRPPRNDIEVENIIRIW